MVVDTTYYDDLDCKPDVSQDELRKAYRKLALSSHPDKHPDDPGAADLFKKYTRAYEVLGDPEKRQEYDLYGINGRIPGGAGAGAGAGPGADSTGGMPDFFSSFNFPGGAGGGTRSASFRFGSEGVSFENPNEFFANFMRQNPGPGMDDDFARAFNPAYAAHPRRSKGRSGSTFADIRGQREGTPELTETVERVLPLTLEELFHGITKKMKVKQKKFEDSGKQHSKDVILEVPIKPGLKKGTKIKFAGVGDQVEGGRQDLHFIVDEKPHVLFSRDNNNLVHVVVLSLKEALTGWKRTVQTIDGKQLPLEKSNPTQPESTDCYPGLGMPISKEPGQRGDFIIKYKVEFPSTLKPEQKQALKDIL